MFDHLSEGDLERTIANLRLAVQDLEQDLATCTDASERTAIAGQLFDVRNRLNRAERELRIRWAWG